MSDPLRSGCLVKIADCEARGVAKLIHLEQDLATVEWFRSLQDRDTKDFPAEKVERVVPSDQTRCYVCDRYGENWRMGRIQEVRRREGQDGWDYVVHFPDDEGGIVAEELVYVRCMAPVADPLEAIAMQAHETPFFYERRRGFVKSLVEQRASSHGLSGLLSSRIVLYRHQVEVVRRVLADPIQRYLLADEVGLGKTIEAGVVVRQLLIDDPAARVLIIVPPQLEAQWCDELEDHFGMSLDEDEVYVVDMRTAAEMAPGQYWDMVVIDEAHHAASLAAAPTDAVVWNACKRLAHEAPRLLLLSATPALHHERDFLAMLHLLEPQTYGLDDLPEFRKRITDRQPIGRLLLRLKEGTPRPLLRMMVSDMQKLFPDDDWLLGQVSDLDECCTCAPFDEQRVSAIIRSVRVHICETHRIFRRMLRSSRALLDEGVLVPRSWEPDAPRIEVESGFDGRLDLVERRLDEWREAAAADVWSCADPEREVRLGELADVLQILVALSGTDPNLLSWACGARADGVEPPSLVPGPILSDYLPTLVGVPHFRDEPEFLRAIVRELEREPEEGSQAEWLVECVRFYASRSDCKLLVFTCYTPVAAALADSLQADSDGARVYRHLHGMPPTQLRAELNAYASDTRAAVLVCDSTAEEGVNLQCVDRVFHFDLPTSPNRLEQRIGRVDRIGRRGEVISTVFVGSEDEASLHDAWLRMMRDGFRIFSESTADLQFYIEQAVPSLWRQTLVDGVGALLAAVERVREEVGEERQTLREQTALDEIQAFEDDEVETFDQLAEFDAGWPHIQEEFEAWAIDVIRLQPWVPNPDEAAHDEYGLQLQDHGQEVLAYRPTQYSLIPAEWRMAVRKAQKVKGASDLAFLSGLTDTGMRFGSFSREVVVASGDVSLYRLGHPLIDLLSGLVQWDDRGQAAAIWRCFSGLPPTAGDCMFFLLDYILEGNLGPALDLCRDIRLGDGVAYALHRQVDAWLPPVHRTVCVSDSLQMMESPRLVEVLQRPYERVGDGGTDYNLDGERLWALDEIVARDRWPELCRSVRELAAVVVEKDPGIKNAVVSGSRRASNAMERRMDQIRRGLIGRGLPRGSCDTTNHITVEEEQYLYEALVQGIRRPEVRLDSICAVILSNRDPFG